MVIPYLGVGGQMGKKQWWEDQQGETSHGVGEHTAESFWLVQISEAPRFLPKDPFQADHNHLSYDTASISVTL